LIWFVPPFLEFLIFLKLHSCFWEGTALLIMGYVTYFLRWQRGFASPALSPWARRRVL